MLTYTDPETLMLMVEQRRDDLLRSMQASRNLAARLAGASRRPDRAGKVVQMRPSKRPA